MFRLHTVLKSFLGCAAVMLSIAGPVVATAQTRETSRVPAEVRAAQEFLFAAYPDLMRQPLTLQLRPEGGAWLVSVAEAPAPRRAGEPVVPEAPPPVLLRGTIAFDARGRLTGYQAGGPYLFDGPNAVLRGLVRSNPHWIDSDADVELMRLGGTSVIGLPFIPRGANPESTAVSRHLGGFVTVGAAQFALRAQSADGSVPAVKAVWLLEATAADTGEAPTRYQFTYEPIGGRLVGVTKVAGAK